MKIGVLVCCVRASPLTTEYMVVYIQLYACALLRSGPIRYSRFQASIKTAHTTTTPSRAHEAGPRRGTEARVAVRTHLLGDVYVYDGQLTCVLRPQLLPYKTENTFCAWLCVFLHLNARARLESSSGWRIWAVLVVVQCGHISTNL